MTKPQGQRALKIPAENNGGQQNKHKRRQAQCRSGVQPRRQSKSSGKHRWWPTKQGGRALCCNGFAIPGNQNGVGNNGGGQQNNAPAQTNEGKPRRPIIEEAAVVKDLIEKCVNMYLNRDEVVEILRLHSRIDPQVTLLVWQKLEQDNPDFFRAYHRRVVLCKQIETFNRLLQMQSELIDVQRLRLEACSISQAESTASNLNFLPEPLSCSGNTPSNNNSPADMDISEESGNGSDSPGSLHKSYSDPGRETKTESNPPIPSKNNSF